MPSLTWRGMIYFLKMAGTKHRLTEQSYKHHHQIGQLYVALRKTGKPLKWYHTSDDTEGRFDCAMDWQGVFIPFEVHRGTQPVDVVVKKAEYYAKKPNCRPVWALSDYRPNPLEEIEKTAQQTGNEILNALTEVGITAQPLITRLEKFTQDPLSKVLVSPRNYAISLLEIVSDSPSV